MFRWILSKSFLRLAFASAWVGMVNLAGAQVPNIAGPPHPPANIPLNGIQIGPIEGWTTEWHPIPTGTRGIPTGSNLLLRQDLPPASEIHWEGAVEVERTTKFSLARCTIEATELYTITAAITNRKSEEKRTSTCQFRGIAISAGQLVLSEIEAALVLPLEAPTSNEETMDAFFSREAIGGLYQIDEEDYLTSVDQNIELKLDVAPSSCAWLVEWRGALGSALGPDRIYSFPDAELWEISVGPPAVARTIKIQSYSVTIDLVSGNRIHSGEPVLYKATTEPPGFEDYVTWLSSTKYGTANPILGSGASFLVLFEGIYGPNGDQESWTGVRCDHAQRGSDSPPPEELGACCQPGFPCRITTEADCPAPPFGFWLGPNTECRFPCDVFEFDDFVICAGGTLPDVPILVCLERGGHGECGAIYDWSIHQIGGGATVSPSPPSGAVSVLGATCNGVDGVSLTVDPDSTPGSTATLRFEARANGELLCQKDATVTVGNPGPCFPLFNEVYRGCPGREFRVPIVLCVNDASCNPTYQWTLTQVSGGATINFTASSGTTVIPRNSGFSCGGVDTMVSIDPSSPVGSIASLRLAATDLAGRIACDHLFNVTVEAASCTATANPMTICPGDTEPFVPTLRNESFCTATFDWSLSLTGGGSEILLGIDSPFGTISIPARTTVQTPLANLTVSPASLLGATGQVTLDVRYRGQPSCSTIAPLTTPLASCAAFLGDASACPGSSGNLELQIINTGPCASIYDWTSTVLGGATDVTLTSNSTGTLALSPGESQTVSVGFSVNAATSDNLFDIEVDVTARRTVFGFPDCTASGRISLERSCFAEAGTGAEVCVVSNQLVHSSPADFEHRKLPIQVLLAPE